MRFSFCSHFQSLEVIENGGASLSRMGISVFRDTPLIFQNTLYRTRAARYLMYRCTPCQAIQSMYITIDTSALIAVIGNERPRRKIIEYTTGYSLCAPASVHWEIGNAFSAMFKRQKINLEQAKKGLAIYNKIPIRFIDVPLAQTLELSMAHGIYAYDAYLIQCALQTGTELLTLDQKLATTARNLGISTPEIAI